MFIERLLWAVKLILKKTAKYIMANLRSPGLKVKLLVGPTCKIQLNSKELSGNKAIT